MAGKSVLVTGGTGGIGKATAIGLAALGARVGITGRDQARAVAAAAGIRAATGRAAVEAFAADMSARAEVRRLAAQVAGTYPRLDVLVNNVGGFWAHRHVTADGLEHTFALNHLAPFLLTNLLLDRLTASAPARIVTVSSGAQARGRIDFDDLQGQRNYSRPPPRPPTTPRPRPHAGITEIGAVYLGAAVIAAASPTPGGLGAIEAALVAGLTGIGVPPGPAVSAVLTYRLATYWLPVIPGWAAWRLLQRRDYV